MFYKHAGTGSAAVGFKIMVSQIQKLPGIMAFFKDQDVTCFYLYREDTFATALSYFRAKISGSFHSDQTNPRTMQRPVTVDEEQFRRVFETCKHDRSIVCDLHRTYGGHLLVYEDMVTKWDYLIDSIGRELGLSGIRVEKALAKVGEHGGGVCITNEAELRKQFSIPESA
jgi:hypothetical protein